MNCVFAGFLGGGAIFFARDLDLERTWDAIDSTVVAVAAAAGTGTATGTGVGAGDDAAARATAALTTAATCEAFENPDDPFDGD